MAKATGVTRISAKATSGITSNPMVVAIGAVGDITTDPEAAAAGVRGIDGKPRCC